VSDEPVAYRHRISCYRKQKFKKKSNAAQVAKRMEKRYPPIQFSAYYCTACGEYHVGSKDYPKDPRQDHHPIVVPKVSSGVLNMLAVTDLLDICNACHEPITDDDTIVYDDTGRVYHQRCVNA